MNWLLKASILGAAVLSSSSLAAPGCGIPSGSVRILSNEIHALRVVADAAGECASSSVTVTSNQTSQHASIQIPALTANPAEYTVAMVSNNSMTSLLNDGLIRPLDALVARYGQQLKRNQLIKIDGKVMAIAFMVDAQHLVYREDVLAKSGIPVPKTYEEVLEAAKVIRKKGVLKYPLAATYLPDWDLGEEFVNMYRGYGGEFFEPGSAIAAIDNEKGIKAWQMMKALSAYMQPEFLTFSTEVVVPIWEAGEVAMANLWDTRAQSFLPEHSSVPKIAAVTRFAAAPTVGGGTIPATTMWWNGFTLARNISEKDAEASFRAMMHAIAPNVARAHPTEAVWLIDGYQPTAAAAGVLASMSGGAKPYPMLPYMGYLHTAIGSNIVGFMQGKQSAQQALSAAVAAYSTAAREAGYLR